LFQNACAFQGGAAKGGTSVSICGKPRRLTSRLFRQADLLTESFYSRIATNQVELRKAEGSAGANWTQQGHAIERFERALLVAQTRKDQSLRERVCGAGRKFLSLVAVTCASQCVAQKGAGICRIGIRGEELDGFLDPSLS